MRLAREKVRWSEPSSAGLLGSQGCSKCAASPLVLKQLGASSQVARAASQKFSVQFQSLRGRERVSFARATTRQP